MKIAARKGSLEFLQKLLSLWISLKPVSSLPFFRFDPEPLISCPDSLNDREENFQSPLMLRRYSHFLRTDVGPHSRTPADRVVKLMFCCDQQPVPRLSS